MRKMGCLSCGRGNLKTSRRWVSAVRPLKGPTTRQNKPGSPVRPLKEKELGPFGELSTSNPGFEVPGVALEAPNVSARRADDIDMGDEVAQRSVSDAEFVDGEPRRRNSPSDPTSKEIEDHVLTRGMQAFDHGVQPVSKGVVEPKDTREMAARSSKMVRKSRLCRGTTASLGPRIVPVKLRWNSVEIALFW